MLALREVVPYLLHRKLLHPRSVVEGDLVLIDASRRNRNFKVTSNTGPSYFLKQGVGPDGIATVAHEAAIYQHLLTNAKDFHRFLPHLCSYDVAENILILELLPDVQTLREYHEQRGRFAKTFARTLGNALGALHRLPPFKETDDKNRNLFAQPPWILFLHQPHIRLFREVSSANLQLIKIIQKFGAFGELFTELREGWKRQSLINRDIKWDNCIVFAQSPSGRKTRLKIIDWEFAGMGDPCWDVGSVFNDYLSFWLLSIPITGETPPEKFLELARYPLERMQPALLAFWNAYKDRMELDSATADEWLMRAVRFGAARLTQTAYEQMRISMQLTGNVVCCLQLSLNILQRPLEATVHLLGLSLRGEAGLSWTPTMST